MSNFNPQRFHPTQGYLFMKLKLEKLSKGGLHIPERAQQGQARAVPVAEIIEAGPDAQTFKRGDLVLFALKEAAGIADEWVLVDQKHVWARVDVESVIAQAH